MESICTTSAGWKSTEKTLGDAEERVAKKCCEDNLQAEIIATLTDGVQARGSDGRVPISVSTDMGWQKKGAGRAYNSN